MSFTVLPDLLPIRAPRRRSAWARALALAAALAVPGGLPGAGLVSAQENKPYDEQLMRLAEILGAVHYLRELCSASDGQMWRQHMRTLIDAESSNALRKARITRSFNDGYRSYSRTYTTCTPSAQTAIDRFMQEGVEISEGLVARAP
jgi:uncharacterized protein (TIGR02301 family)